MAPQTIDMQSTGGGYFKLALAIKDILTVVHTQFYNSGSMLGCDQMAAYCAGHGQLHRPRWPASSWRTACAPTRSALGLPAGPGAAGGGVVAPSLVNQALDCLARGTNCGSFRPPRTYPGIRGAMTWSINWDVSNGNGFASTVKPAPGHPALMRARRRPVRTPAVGGKADQRPAVTDRRSPRPRRLRTLRITQLATITTKTATIA